MLLSLILTLSLGCVCDGINAEARTPAEIQTIAYPNEWEAWLKDENRMEWWRLHGWILLAEVKSNTPSYKGEGAQEYPLHPINLGLEPDSSMPKQWAFVDGSGIHLHALDRCEVLYQRYLINEGAQVKSIKQ
jgi:hypothetical protein